MRYEGTVYRPPSEAGSLIIQLTIGCARNTCTFCNMYKDKKFRIRPLEEVVEDLEMARSYYSRIKVRRIFLADGDALIVKTEDLLYIIAKCKEIFPEVERISVYGAPKDILHKTPEELATLKAAGLDMVYMGLESGADEVLQAVKKGVTADEMIEAGKKVRAAGMVLSMTVISGLGGKKLWREHALGSARVISTIKPEYVGFLTLMIEPGTEMYDQYNRGEIELLTPHEVLDETETQVLFYQDSYAWVPYHQSSNGKTRSGKEVIGGDTYPYLATRECLEDVKAEDEMHVYQFSYDEIKKKCRSFLEAAEGEAEAKKALKFEDFEIQEKDSAGYVSKFRIGNTVCSGDEFRDALSLASSAFSIQEESGGLKITTMGKGHGLGMSQWTANELAKNGQNYKEILEFFFEGTTITNSEEILEKPE